MSITELLEHVSDNQATQDHDVGTAGDIMGSQPDNDLDADIMARELESVGIHVIQKDHINYLPRRCRP